MAKFTKIGGRWVNFELVAFAEESPNDTKEGIVLYFLAATGKKGGGRRLAELELKGDDAELARRILSGQKP